MFCFQSGPVGFGAWDREVFRVWSTVILLCGIIIAAPASAEIADLQEFLRGVETANAIAMPLRGDGNLDVVSPEATQHYPLALILRPPADLYVDLQNGMKALVPATGDAAYLLKPGATKADTFPPDAALAGSDFTREDLEPFRLAHYQDWRISDESAGEVTVTLFPQAASQYTLVVITFDAEKRLPLKTLYYRDTLSNLVKMRRDSDYVLVGRKPMATTVTMETFKLRTHSTFTLQWTQNPIFPPELFDPVFLSHPAGIAWPTMTAAPAR